MLLKLTFPKTAICRCCRCGCFLMQFGHTHSTPRSSISTPNAFVTLTHLPWNQSSHLSQQIMNRLLCGVRHIHHSLENRLDSRKFIMSKYVFCVCKLTDMDHPLSYNYHPSHLPPRHRPTQSLRWDRRQSLLALLAMVETMICFSASLIYEKQQPMTFARASHWVVDCAILVWIRVLSSESWLGWLLRLLVPDSELVA